jgi:hypothetical protein
VVLTVVATFGVLILFGVGHHPIVFLLLFVALLLLLF